MIMTDTHNPTPSKPLNDMHGRVCSAGAPFARLQLGKNIYEIANAIADTDMLAFRGDGCRTWTALDRRQSDGWARLGADILLADPDSYYDFLQTHAVRVSGDSRKGGPVQFDTLGQKWSVRLEDGGRCLLEFGDDEWSEVDLEGSCLRLIDSKEGSSVRPVGLPVVEYLEKERPKRTGTYVFPGQGIDNAVGNFPQSWKKLFKDTPLWDVTPHVLRHSFASIANDLGFTEITIAALIGHAKGSVTSKYVHTLDSTLIMAADTASGYVKALLEGVEFRRNTYTLDRQSRQSAINQLLVDAIQ